MYVELSLISDVMYAYVCTVNWQSHVDVNADSQCQLVWWHIGLWCSAMVNLVIVPNLSTLIITATHLQSDWTCTNHGPLDKVQAVH